MVCLDLQQPITVTCKLIDAVNVRTTEEAEPAADGSIKENQQLPSVVASVNTARTTNRPSCGSATSQKKNKKTSGLHMEPHMEPRRTYVNTIQHVAHIVVENDFIFFKYRI